MRSWRVVAPIALSLLLVLCGCSATVQVGIQAQPNGTGAVTVTLTLDKAATQSIGDVGKQLQTADLAAAGWTVTGPTTTADGSTIVRATKPFSTLAQASAIVQEIAGTGPPSSSPFQLRVIRHKTFWKTTTTLTGSVDLRCGLNCFGDPGLKAVIGSATGIDPATAQRDTGVDPTGIFHFGLGVELPGSLHSTNAQSSQRLPKATQLSWTPALGKDVTLAAVTETTDTGHVVEVAVAAGIGAAVVLGLLIWLGVWRWRKRRRRKRAAGAGEGDDGGRRRRNAPAHARRD